MKIKEIIHALENWAPVSLQESYDNCGLLLGNGANETNSILVSLDCTEEVVDEAINLGCELLVAHHPLIFSGIKRINGRSNQERAIIKAIKNNLAVYAFHTNLDNAAGGVSFYMAQKLGLDHIKVLRPIQGELMKLVTFVPLAHTEQVRQALFGAGAGQVGAYDECSFNLQGEGTFRALEGSQPFVGEIGKRQHEPEWRVETIVPKHKLNHVLQALFHAHPYEEVAYDLIPLQNSWSRMGAGAVGQWAEAYSVNDFLAKVKACFGGIIRYAGRGEHIRTVALCGGSGSFLLSDAIRAGADAYISSDFKYHQFFEANQDILLADIGHFEGEQFTIELISNKLSKLFPSLAVHQTGCNTNPIQYF